MNLRELRQLPERSINDIRSLWPLFSQELCPLILRLKSPRMGTVIGYGDKHEGNLRLCVDKKSIYSFHWMWLHVEETTQLRLRAMFRNNELATYATLPPLDVIQFGVLDAARPRSLTAKDLPEKPAATFSHEQQHLLTFSPGVPVVDNFVV